jgi:arginine/lysine/ornithine decarboxylase
MAIGEPDSVAVLSRFNAYLSAHSITSPKSGIHQTSDLIRTLCEKREARVVVMGLTIFDGRNPLIHFLKFFEHVYNDKFDDAKNSMETFIQEKGNLL